MRIKIRFFVGALTILFFIASIGYINYLSAKELYFDELKSTIENKYLEGQNEIGAYDLLMKDITLYKVSTINDPIGAMLSVSGFGWWGGLSQFSNRNIISLVNAKENNYEWVNLNLGGSGSPFLVVLKKTERGYDLIGEYIVGIGIKYGFPKVFVKSYYPTDGNDLFSIDVAPNLAQDYVNYLFDDKYRNCLIRNERENNINFISLDEFGRSGENPKLRMLEELVVKMSCKIDESLFFRTNKYFELKLDDYYTEIGSGTVVWDDNTYGNDIQNLFTRTVTIHYSIQENKGVLEDEYMNKYFIIALVCLLFYLLVVFILNKKVKEAK